MNFQDCEIDEGVIPSSRAAGPLRVEKLQFFRNGRVQHLLANQMQSHLKQIEIKQGNGQGRVAANVPESVLNVNSHVKKDYNQKKESVEVVDVQERGAGAGSDDLGENPGDAANIISAFADIEPKQGEADVNKSHGMPGAPIPAPEPRDQEAVDNGVLSVPLNHSSWDSLVNINSEQVLQQNLFDRDKQLDRLVDRLLAGAP